MLRKLAFWSTTIFVSFVSAVAIADLLVVDGGGAPRTIKNFVCETTKLCNATVLIKSDGTEVGTASAPVRTDPTGSTIQPVSGTVAATQSGTWTVQPGNTPNTIPWLFAGNASNAGSGAAAGSANVPAIAYLYGFNGTTYDQLQVDGSKFLKVNCAAGCSAGSAADVTANLSGMTANNAATPITLAGTSSVSVLLSGTWTATVTPEVSSDGGTTWVATSFYNANTHAVTATVAANGTYDIMGTGGKSSARVRISAFTSGTVTGQLRAVTQAPSANDAQASALAKLDTLHTDLNADIPNVTIGNTAPATATATKALLWGVQYNSTQASFTNGQQGTPQISPRGAFYVAPGVEGFPVTTPDTRPASGNITIQDTGSASASGQNSVSIITGTPTAASFYTQAINGQSTARIQVSGTWTGTLTIEGSMDGGSTYVAQPARVTGTVFTSSSLTANGQFTLDTAGLTHVRIRATAAMTGTAVAVATFGVDAGTTNVLNPVRFYDNVSGAQATVKPASTAAAPTDTSIVVQSNPASPAVAAAGQGAPGATVPAGATLSGARAQSAEAAAVTDGQLVSEAASLVGKKINLPYANPENTLNGQITSAMTATTSTALTGMGAQGAGVRVYATGCTVSNSHASVGTMINLQDGSGGAVLWQLPASPAYGGAGVTFPTPIKTTANTGLFAVNATTGSSTFVSCTGYKGI